MGRRLMRGVLHLVLGGAAAAALIAVAAGMTVTLMHSKGIGRALTLLLVVATVALVARLLVLPVVRPLAAQLARLLLDADVPELADSRDRQARLEGAVWAGISMLVGAVSLLVLLIAVPVAVTLVAQVITREPLVVGSNSYTPDSATRVALALAGAMLLGAAVATPSLGIGSLRRWAPSWLRPSSEELLAAERDRARELARGNAIARDLHDSIGHALTAIGVQAEAALVLGRTDPAAAQDAVVTIRDVAHGAVGELDRVLGVLRASASGEPVHRIADIAAIPQRFPDGVVRVSMLGSRVVASAVGDTAYRVVQEAVTNAVRHGAGEPVVANVETTADGVRIEVTNPVPTGAEVGEGRGLRGMRERVEAFGGRMEVEVADGRWLVRVLLPAGER